MHAINISAKFSLRVVHSIVGCNYFWRQRHARFLACPGEITAPRFAGNRGGKSIKKLFHRQKRGQFEAESVLGDGQSRTGGIALEDIVRSGRVHDLDVRSRTRQWRQSNSLDATPAGDVCVGSCVAAVSSGPTIHTVGPRFQEDLWKSRLSFAFARVCRTAQLLC